MLVQVAIKLWFILLFIGFISKWPFYSFNNQRKLSIPQGFLHIGSRLSGFLSGLSFPWSMRFRPFAKHSKNSQRFFSEKGSSLYSKVSYMLLYNHRLDSNPKEAYLFLCLIIKESKSPPSQNSSIILYNCGVLSWSTTMGYNSCTT
jgi:hypothetical protein